jgi:tripartite-type tricarboxylate transporter receptor subunit TctC
VKISSWAIAAAALTCAGVAMAQSYPSKPIRLIIPAPPGGGVDTVSRAIAPRLSEAIGQPVVADNRPGAGTMIGSELTAKAPPDGYTMLMVTNSHTINAALIKNLRYDPIKDFQPVTQVAAAPLIVLVHPSVPAASVKELIALARRRPAQLLYASAGSGSGTHLAGALFESMAGIRLVHVPYKGGTPGLTDLVGGHVQVMFNNLISAGALMNAGRLRALATTGAKRMAALPQVPTVAESGVPGYETGSWYGVLLPAQTPPEAVTLLHREVVKILKTPEIREKFALEGSEAIGSTPQEFAALMKSEIEKWAKLVPKLGTKLE